jgi:hypothetical protein
VLLGSAFAATPWLARVAAAAGLGPDELAAPVPEPLSVGYLLGSDGYSSVARLPWEVGAPEVVDGVTGQDVTALPMTVVPAASLDAGEHSLSAGVRMSVRGLYPGPDGLDEGGPGLARLDVLYPRTGDAGSDQPRFFAWTLRRSPVVSASPPVTFVVPIDSATGLVVVLELAPEAARRGVVPGLRRRLTRGEPQSVVRSAELSVGAEQGTAKLRRGIYLIGFAAATWEQTVVLPPPGAFAPDLLSIAFSIDGLDATPGG